MRSEALNRAGKYDRLWPQQRCLHWFTLIPIYAMLTLPVGPDPNPVASTKVRTLTNPYTRPQYVSFIRMHRGIICWFYSAILRVFKRVVVLQYTITFGNEKVVLKLSVHAMALSNTKSPCNDKHSTVYYQNNININTIMLLRWIKYILSYNWYSNAPLLPKWRLRCGSPKTMLICCQWC